MANNLDFDNLSDITRKDEKISDDCIEELCSIFNKDNKNNNKTKKNIQYLKGNDMKKNNKYNYESNYYNDINLKQLYNFSTIKSNHKLRKKNKDFQSSIDLSIKEEETKDTNTDNKNSYKKTDYKTIISNSDKKINTLKNSRDFNINNLFVINENNSVKKYNGNYEDYFNLIKLNYNINNEHIDLNFNIDENYQLKLIGNKRNNKDINQKEKEEKEKAISIIFNDIYTLYKNYTLKNPKYKIFEQESGFFKKNYTVVEEDTPIIIIYSNYNLITKIYLIQEQKMIDNYNEIYEVLNKTKNNIINSKSKYP